MVDAVHVPCGRSKSLTKLNFQDEEPSDTLPDVAQLDAMIAEAEEAMNKAETTAEMRKAKERKEDLMRLKRVELIYVGLPFSLSLGRSC